MGTAVTQELTMSEVLRDPMIRQVLRADGISLGSFALMLERAASRRNAQAVVATQPTMVTADAANSTRQ